MVPDNYKADIDATNDNLPALPTDENDDITEYITNSSFEELKKRFGSAEEDKSIRDEDFNPLNTSVKGSKRSSDEDYRSSPSFKKDAELTAPSKLQNEFGTAESRFDNDSISFDEIDIDLNSIGDLVNDSQDASAVSNEEFNTNTRVVFLDENADDGIKRNTDFDVINVFLPD